jgi:hypothetical protein
MSLFNSGFSGRANPVVHPPHTPPGSPTAPGPIVVPSVIAPAAPPPETTAAIVASQTQAAATEAAKALGNNVTAAANLAAARATAATIKAAVSTVPTYAEQRAASATAIVTTPAQRAEVASIVAKAQSELEQFQRSYTTEGGVVVTTKSPTPSDGGIAFGDLPTPSPLVPALVAEKGAIPKTEGPAGVAPGGAANAAGPSSFAMLALAAILLLFVVKV